MNRRQKEDEGPHGGKGVAGETDKDIQGPEGDDFEGRRRGGMKEESVELRGGNERPPLVPGDGGHGGGHGELPEDSVPGITGGPAPRAGDGETKRTRRG